MTCIKRVPEKKVIAGAAQPVSFDFLTTTDCVPVGSDKENGAAICGGSPLLFGAGAKPDETCFVIATGGCGGFAFFARDEYGRRVTNPKDISVAFAEGSSKYLHQPVVDPVVGEIVVALTVAGHAALKQGESFSEVLTVMIHGIPYTFRLTGDGSASKVFRSGSGDVAYVQV